MARRARRRVAVGEVILGDKEKAGEYKKYNDGHVPDLVQPGASAWGTDWIGETKVPSPLGAAPAQHQCETLMLPCALSSQSWSGATAPFLDHSRGCCRYGWCTTARSRS